VTALSPGDDTFDVASDVEIEVDYACDVFDDPVSQADTNDIVGRYLHALRNRDLQTVMAVVAEDAEYWIAGDNPVAGT
jgi:hypothetical protein